VKNQTGQGDFTWVGLIVSRRHVAELQQVLLLKVAANYL